MIIEQGLIDGQVLQRNAKNIATFKVAGRCDGGGSIEVRVLKGRKALKGLDWKTVGQARRGRISAECSGIPCGGPYTLEWRLNDDGSIRERLRITDVWVGDVWFLAGQSNMQGIGLMENAPSPNARIRCFYMRDVWDEAREPLHLLGEAVDPVHNSGQRLSPDEAAGQRCELQRGVGPGLFFALEMLRYTDVPQGLVACAHGGTSMESWSPTLKDKGGSSLYGAMLRRFRKLGQPIRGILWYQGESDCFPATAEVYTECMKALVKAVRRDFRQPRLAWITVQIGRVHSDTWQAGPWNSIQDQQRRLPGLIRDLETVPAHDLEMDDMIHIGSRGQAMLAERMARMAQRLAFGDTKQPGSIRLAGIKEHARRRPDKTMQFEIELVFDNVAGSLRSAGVPNGFYLLDSNGKPLSTLYKVRLEGNRAILETTLPPSMVFKFGYGQGCVPFCNITDERGMPAPLFGPLLMSGQRGSAFLINWQISGPYPEHDMRTCACPGDKLDWRAPHSVATSLIMPQNTQSPHPGLFYFRTQVEAETDMDVKMAMGADSPFRAWINGKPAGEDLLATNPCVPDEMRYPVHLHAGINEVTIAFDGRNGMGWGLCMRFLPMNRRQSFKTDAIVEWTPDSLHPAPV